MKVMNCPMCGAKMVSGELVHKGAFFLPDRETMPWLFTEGSMKRHGATMLKPQPIKFSRQRCFPAAFRCDGCKLLVVNEV